MHHRGALLAMLASTLLAAIGSAHAQCFTEFRASPGSDPAGITTGPDGNLWFTEFAAGNVARILPSPPNTLTEFPVSAADIRPAGITAGPDGNLWFVEILGNNVGRITPDSPNTITRFAIPTAAARPQDIVLGPDGNLWFTEAIGKIGRITPDAPNTITEFPVPSGQGPGGITVGPDGNLWFAETFVAGNEGGNKVARMLPESPNTITEFTIPTPAGAPGDITTGPDGNLWFTEIKGNSIGRITPDAPNTITEFPVLTVNARPGAIVTGPDGNLWFSEGGTPGQLGRIQPDSPNTVTQFTIPGGDITNGPDGNLWFTQIFQSVWRLAIADCDKCAAGKLDAIGKVEKTRLGCLAKFAKTGDAEKLAECVAKAGSKYTGSFAKAGECGSSEEACQGHVDSCVGQVLANLPELNACEAAKLKAVSRMAGTLFKCSVKSALKGKPADPGCVLVLSGSKLQPKLDAAFAKADLLGPCAGDSFGLGVVLELACHLLIPISDSAGTVTGLICA